MVWIYIYIRDLRLSAVSLTTSRRHDDLAETAFASLREAWPQVLRGHPHGAGYHCGGASDSLSVPPQGRRRRLPAWAGQRSWRWVRPYLSLLFACSSTQVQYACTVMVTRNNMHVTNMSCCALMITRWKCMHVLWWSLGTTCMYFDGHPV